MGVAQDRRRARFKASLVDYQLRCLRDRGRPAPAHEAARPGGQRARGAGRLSVPPVQRTRATAYHWVGAASNEVVRMSAFAVAIGGKADMPFCAAHVCF